MFKYKTEEELGKMTTEQRDIYAEQKRAFEAESTKKMIADAIKERFPTRFQELKADPANATKSDAEINALVKAEQDAAIEEAKNRKAEFDALKQDVQEIKEQTNGGGGKPSAIKAEFIANKTAIENAVKSGIGEVTLKTTVARSAVQSSTQGTYLPGIGQLLRVARSLYDVFTKKTITNGDHNGTLKYLDWDEATTTKAAAMVAEGGTYPESVASFKQYTVSLVKVGDTLPVNEEFFTDQETAAAELETFINLNCESKIDDQLVNGDGTGNNLKGLLASIPTYTPVASGVVDAGIYDLLMKMKTAITKPAGAKYKPNFGAMNSTTLDILKLKKDANYNLQYPLGHPIYDFIVEDNSIPDDTIVVGDGRYAEIWEMGGIMVSRGVVNAQFTTDQITLKAGRRLLFLIKNANKSGFLKITGITAACTTLSS